MRLIFEACQDQHHFLSILVTQISTEWIRKKKHFLLEQCSKKRKLKKEKLKPVFSEKEEFDLSPDYQIVRTSGDFNAGTGLTMF